MKTETFKDWDNFMEGENDFNEFAWVIETRSFREPQYWVGKDIWSVQSLDAMRFSRQQDAERAMNWMVPQSHFSMRVIEHGWIKLDARGTA